MGRNGAGKSTLLRHAGALMAPTRGRVQLQGELALLLQNPGDLFVHEHVREEASPDGAAGARASPGWRIATRATCRAGSASAWRSRSCWAASGRRARSPSTSPPGEWTARPSSASRAGSRSRARQGALVLVATHDCEFAVEFATRAVLLARGRVIADGPDPRGPRRRALLHDRIGAHPRRRRGRRARRRGRRVLLRARRARRRQPRRRRRRGRLRGAGRARGGREVSWQLAAFAIVLLTLGAAFWWYERSRPPAKLVALVGALAALAALGRDAFAAVPDVKPITAIVLVTGVAFGPRPGSPPARSRRSPPTCCSGEGPWTPWQMLGLGARRPARRGPRRARRPAPVAAGDRAGLRGCGRGVQPAARLLHLDRDRLPYARRLRRRARRGAGLRRHPRGRQLRLRPGLRGGPAADAAAGPRPHARDLERPGGRGAADRGAPSLPATRRHPAGRALAGGERSASAGARGASGVPRALPEPRRRLRRRARGSRAASCTPPGRRSASPPPATSRGCSSAPAIRCSTRCARAPARCRAPATSSARSSRCAPAAPRPARCPAATRRRGCSPTRAATAPSSTSSNLTEFAILSLRAAGLPASSRQVRAAARWLVAQQEPDGGFGFGARPPAAAPPRATWTTPARPSRRWSRPASTGTRSRARRATCSRPEPRRRLSPAARRGLQRPVHGLGGAGPRRRRHERVPRAPRRQRLAAAVPRRPDGRLGERALLAHQQPDAGVGHRAGAVGAGRQAAAGGAPAGEPRARRHSPRTGPCARRPGPAAAAGSHAGRPAVPGSSEDARVSATARAARGARGADALAAGGRRRHERRRELVRRRLDAP